MSEERQTMNMFQRSKCPMANSLLLSPPDSDLSTDREVSSIPRDDKTNWVYPSENMFWRALERKNKTYGATKEDMRSVINVHNSVNEETWRKIIRWEQTHFSQTEQPILHQFYGKYSHKSFKARWLRWTCRIREYPFDRHDWYIKRKDGTIIRYVIDYHAFRDKFFIDARPASDSISMIVYKLWLWTKSWF